MVVWQNNLKTDDKTKQNRWLKLGIIVVSGLILFVAFEWTSLIKETGYVGTNFDESIVPQNIDTKRQLSAEELWREEVITKLNEVSPEHELDSETRAAVTADLIKPPSDTPGKEEREAIIQKLNIIN